MAYGATNTLLTPTIIAREALRLLKNNLVMGQLVYRAYESEFPGSPKKGGTVTIRKPVKFQVTKSRVRASSHITEQSITMSVATQAHVSWSFYMVDLTLTIEEYSDRYIRPAAAVLANTIDADLCALYDDVWNMVVEDTSDVEPHTFMIIGKSQQMLDEEAAPKEDRCIVFNPAAHWTVANALAGMYAPEPATTAIRKGKLGTVAGVEIYMDQNIKTHTTGKFGTATADATTGRLLIHSTASVPTGITPGVTPNQRIAILPKVGVYSTSLPVLELGDVLRIEGVYAVNPMSGESTGSLRCFTVTADAQSSLETTLGDFWVYVQPDVINTGPYKTVSTTPAAGSKVWPLMGSPATVFPQNLAFHKNAFALCMVPLEKPDSAWGSTITEDGFSIRVVKQYEIGEDEECIRLDVLYGVKTIYPELACRVLGKGQ